MFEAKIIGGRTFAGSFASGMKVVRADRVRRIEVYDDVKAYCDWLREHDCAPRADVLWKEYMHNGYILVVQH